MSYLKGKRPLIRPTDPNDRDRTREVAREYSDRLNRICNAIQHQGDFLEKAADRGNESFALAAKDAFDFIMGNQMAHLVKVCGFLAYETAVYEHQKKIKKGTTKP